MDGETPTVSHAIAADGDVVRSVVEAVAAVDNRQPTALPPLGETLDPDALTALTESAASVRISFDYCDYRVVVSPETVELY
jgi:hypothetical protein